MKKIYEKKFGGGDIGSAGIYLDNGDIVQMARYPVAKIIEPATNALDKLLDKLEAAIPGDWDKPYVETLKKEYKEELIALIGNQLPDQTPA